MALGCDAVGDAIQGEDYVATAAEIMALFHLLGAIAMALGEGFVEKQLISLPTASRRFDSSQELPYHTNDIDFLSSFRNSPSASGLQESA